MAKKDVIDELMSLGAEVNPALTEAKLKEQLKAIKDKSALVIETPSQNSLQSTPPSATAPTTATDTQKILDMMSGVVGKLDAMDKRMTKMEDGGKNEFKTEANQADIDAADVAKSNIDPRIVKIVEETLGTDFAIELESYDDKPGILFTVVVPGRLSDVPKGQRPVVDKETGKYKIMPGGGPYDYIMETYQPQDRRSWNIGTSQSYEAIRQHCNRVRSHIVSYYQKLKRPLPEFKIK